MNDEYAADICYLLKDLVEKVDKLRYAVGPDNSGIEERLDRLIDVIYAKQEP